MRWLLWWRPPCLLRSVLVNLTADNPDRDRDRVISGVLWASRGAWLTVKDAQVQEGSGTPMKVDGEVVVHRDKVSFIQVLPL
jgi:hypothetical protein